MAKCKVDFRELEKLQKRLNSIEKERVQQFNEEIIKELAARLLAKAKERTPVRKPVYRYEALKDQDGNDATYKRDGKKHKKGEVKTRRVKEHHGGTLRRGWTISDVIRTSNGYSIEVINPVEYASYVEYGHRTANHQGWVEGKFMLTISKQELEADLPKILENKLSQFLGECFGD